MEWKLYSTKQGQLTKIHAKSLFKWSSLIYFKTCVIQSLGFLFFICVSKNMYIIDCLSCFKIYCKNNIVKLQSLAKSSALGWDSELTLLLLGDNNNEKKENPHLNTVLGNKDQGVEIRDKGYGTRGIRDKG